MFSIPASTSFVFVFKAYLSSDHVSEATGKTIAITISKNGGAFGNPAAGATNATEISSGWYKVTLGAGDTDTNGILAVRGAVATIDDVGDRLLVVNATNGGLTALPATACTTNASLITSGTGTAQISVTSGRVKADVEYWNGSAVHTPDTVGYPVVTIKDGTGQGEIDLASGAVVSVLSAELGSASSNLIDTAIGNHFASDLVTVGANNDKTGYSLSQTFPSNFASLGISAAGNVNADIKKVNGTTITGAGTSGSPWGP